MKTAHHLLALVLLSSHISIAQVNDQLPLRKPSIPDPAQMNTVSLTLPTAVLHGLHEAKGKKLSLKVSSIMVNDDTFKIKHFHVRGQTSSYYRRKSFNIKTTKKATFHTGSKSFSLSKFYAISMNMDRNYIRNRMSFAILKLVDVHTPSNAYANLVINGSSEGLYLIFYPPDDYAMKKHNATFVSRRGYGESMDKVYAADGLEREQERDLKKRFRSLYSADMLNKSGENLYNDLANILDLDTYFSWLAFNHLFQNGDYADEAYFMWNVEKSRFEIIPWDFDDLLESHPHEGVAEREKLLSDRLIFSLEDQLDRKIASDPYLYEKYLKAYAALLHTLTTEKLRDVLVRVFDEVYPYFVQQDIIAQSKFDQHGVTDISKLENDLNSIYRHISIKADGMRKNFVSVAR